jgi:hypothetical protein
MEETRDLTEYEMIRRGRQLELDARSFGPCACGCGRTRRKNMLTAAPDCRIEASAEPKT